MRKLLVLVVLFLISGCWKSSAPTAHLAGTVTISGAIIPSDADAGLAFKPPGSGKAVSVPIKNGHYDSPNTPVGSVSVQFYISRRVGPVKKSERTGEDYQDIANLVPPDKATGVTITVSEDNLNQNFQL
jgi:hypothetical protein